MSFPLSSSCQVWFSSIFLSLYWIDFSDLNWCCHFIQQYICIFLDLTLSFVSIHFKVTSVFIPSSISVNHFIIIIIILRVCVRKLWTSYELWMQQSQNVLLKRYSSRIHCINHDKSMHLRIYMIGMIWYVCIISLGKAKAWEEYSYLFSMTKIIFIRHKTRYSPSLELYLF